MRDHIGESLGIAPDILTGEVLEPVRDDTEANKGKDFDYARKNMYDIIDKSLDALGEMLELAKASENPNAYDTLANLIKVSMGANKDLVDLSNIASQKQIQNTTTNNTTIFEGSTADLQKMIINMKEAENNE